MRVIVWARRRRQRHGPDVVTVRTKECLHFRPLVGAQDFRGMATRALRPFGSVTASHDGRGDVHVTAALFVSRHDDTPTPCPRYRGSSSGLAAVGQLTQRMVAVKL